MIKREGGAEEEGKGKMEEKATELTDYRIKIIENPGQTISSLLLKNSLSQTACSRMDCWLCKTNG